MDSIKRLVNHCLISGPSVIRLAVLLWGLGWFFNASSWLHIWNHNTGRQFVSHPVFEPFFLNTEVAIASYYLPILPLLCLLLLPEKLSKTKAVLAALLCGSAAIMVMHIESYNHATFMTSFWAGVWLLWWYSSKAMGTFNPRHAVFWCQAIIGMIFLSGTVGKITQEYHSGEAIYNMFFKLETFRPIALFRHFFDEPGLRTLAMFLGIGAIFAEGAVAMAIFLSNRAFTLIGLFTIFGIVGFLTPTLFSVMSCLIGMILVSRILDQRMAEGAQSDTEEVSSNSSSIQEIQTAAPDPELSVIFYDGECGLCDRFVQQTLKHDKDAYFKFSALQGEFAAAHLPKALTQEPQSVVLMHNGKVYVKSLAVQKILTQTKQSWYLRILLYLCARWLADFGYSLVARYRHKFAGSPKQCELISETTLKERFFK